MNKNIKPYLEKIVSEISETVIPNIHWEEHGYQNFFTMSREPYEKRLGMELIKDNVLFESLFDIGYGKFDKDEEGLDIDFAKYYEKTCKDTPNHLFLKDILSIQEQRDILLKTISKFDFEQCLDDFTIADSILYILRDFRSIGVDKSTINPEITDIVKSYVANHSDCHANIVISFINEEFVFDEEFMKNGFKNIFNKSFGKDSQEEFDKIYFSNEQNRIKFSYNDMNSSLPVKEGKQIKKRKI